MLLALRFATLTTAAFRVPLVMLPALMLDTVITFASIVPAVSLLADRLAMALLPMVNGCHDPPVKRENELSLAVLNHRSPSV